MKKCIALILCLAPIFFSSANSSLNPPAPDTTIQILIFKEPSVSQSFVNSQVSRMQSVWSNTQFTNGSAPVSLSVINPGAALSTVVNLGGDPLVQIASVKTLVSTSVAGLPSIRDALAADVVIAFVDSLQGLCGFAPQENWSGPGKDFIEGANTPGLDLRGADDDGFGPGYYVALVANDGVCSFAGNSDTAAHELGHLFGAGHYEVIGSPATKTGLYQNSRALIDEEFEFIPCCFSFTLFRRTVMGRQADTLCNGSCQLFNIFSDNSPNLNDLNRRNTDAIDATAVSVAQYRVGFPSPGISEQCVDTIDNDGDGQTDSADQDCVNGGSESPPPPPPPPNCDSSVAPYALNGYLVAICAPNSTASQYLAQWSHACPNDVAFYEVWKSVPDGAPFVFGWIRPDRQTPIFVNATDGRIKVRSCGAGGCSSFTNTFYAVDQC